MTSSISMPQNITSDHTMPSSAYLVTPDAQHTHQVSPRHTPHHQAPPKPSPRHSHETSLIAIATQVKLGRHAEHSRRDGVGLPSPRVLVVALANKALHELAQVLLRIQHLSSSLVTNQKTRRREEQPAVNSSV